MTLPRSASGVLTYVTPRRARSVLASAIGMALTTSPVVCTAPGAIRAAGTVIPATARTGAALSATTPSATSATSFCVSDAGIGEAKWQVKVS